MNYFELVAKKMAEVGMFTYLFPFILLFAFFYAILKKSKVFGDSTIVNGSISFVVSMIIAFYYPIVTGFSIASSLSVFLMQVSVFILIFSLALIAASLFYPNLQEWLPTVFKSRNMLAIMIALGITFFVTSGLIGIFTHGPPSKTPGPPTDVVYFSAVVIIFVVILILASSLSRIARPGG